MIRTLIFLNLFSICSLAYSQVADSSGHDSTTLLNEVIVQGYAHDRPISEVPASIGYVSQKDLERFSNTSLLPAVNTIPGVRMEERSPGSYRFSIRGSLLRSPFGVRNVKFYWNGLPLTDGGGNTYINLLDFNAIQSAEIIKGPGGSLYGAGTGGVVLLNSPSLYPSQVQLSSVVGSYGMQRYVVSGQGGSEHVKASVQYAHQQADGYRAQTKMQRDAVNVNLLFDLSKKSTLSSSIFYTDMYYQTPGGLTRSQYDQDDKQARPATPTMPGAAEQHAAIYNRTFYSGISYDHELNSSWSIKLGGYGSSTDFKNPAIRNYEIRKESNIGGRADVRYKFVKQAVKGKITFGSEYQFLSSPIDVSNNDFGSLGTNKQYADDLTSRLALLFGQAEFDLPLNFYFTAGASGTFLHYTFASRLDNTNQDKKFDPVISPRLALLKKMGENFSVYGSVSKGFSPPSLAEVRPSTNVINYDLNPERGISYEIGTRLTFLQRLAANLSVYNFRLKETIVLQSDASGADYFVNAGSTTQQGIEATVSWQPVINDSGTISLFKIWSGYTLNAYKFDTYIQGGNDYSGKDLTGVSPNIFVAGADIAAHFGLYANITFTYTDRIPLNDANTDYADAYKLLNGRIGFHFNNKTFPFDVFTGVDNALDQRYSLGNDLNAIGGRYFNAAAPRSFYIGFTSKLIFKKRK